MVSPHKDMNPWITDPSQQSQKLSQSLQVLTRTNEAQIWQLGIRDLLNNENGLVEFKAYLEKEFCAESILFYLALRDLDKTPNRERFIEEARSIYEKFIVPNSLQEVNLESSLRESLIKKFSSGNNSDITEYIFDEAEKAIINLMAKNYHGRFLATLKS
jgi:hypothetical protein